MNVDHFGGMGIGGARRHAADAGEMIDEVESGNVALLEVPDVQLLYAESRLPDQVQDALVPEHEICPSGYSMPTVEDS